MLTCAAPMFEVEHLTHPLSWTSRAKREKDKERGGKKKLEAGGGGGGGRLGDVSCLITSISGRLAGDGVVKGVGLRR